MRPLRNTLLSAIVTGSRVVSVAVTMLWLTRALGPTGFGAFMYALTLATTLAVIPDFGFSLQLVARITAAPQHARGLLRSATVAKCYLVAIAALCGLGWVLLQKPSGPQLQMAGILFLSAVALSFGQLNSYAFRSIDRFDLDAVTSAAQSAALVVGVLLAYLLGGGAMAIAWTYLVVRCAYLAMTAALLRALPRQRGTASVESPVRMLRGGISYGIHTAIAVLCVNLDSLILAAYRGDAAVGYYQAGMRLVFAAALIPEILTSGLFPTLSRAMARGEPAEAIRISGIMNRYLLLSGAAGAAVLLIIPGTIRQVLFGSSYTAIDALLPWFGLVIFLRCASTTYGASITAAGAQSSRTVAVAGATVLSLAANFLLIPRFGINGAMAASILTQSTLLLTYAGLARRALGEWLIDRRASAGLAGIVLLTIAALALGSIAPRVAAIAGPLALVGCALRMAVPDHDWRRLRAVLSNRLAAAYRT